MKVILYIVLLVIFINSVFSQTVSNNYLMGVGPQFLMKAGISGVQTPLGRKNGISFNQVPDFGAAAYLPISEEFRLGIQIEACYSSFSYMIVHATNGKQWRNSFSYLTFMPKLYFDGFLLGIGIGLPLSANMEGAEIKTDAIATLVDANIGYVYPILNDETGRLNIFIHAGYNLTTTFNSFLQNDPMKKILPEDPLDPINDSFNTRITHVAMGFNYLFNMSGQQK